MRDFTDQEMGYLLGERRLGRIATVGRDGTPHVTPVGWAYDAEAGTIDVGGHEVARTKKFRDARRTGRAAIVIDDIASVDPWHVRGIEVRGRAEALEGPPTISRIHPQRIVSWGLEDRGIGTRDARTVR